MACTNLHQFLHHLYTIFGVDIKNYKEIHESESIKNPVIPGYEVIYRVIKICSSLQFCKDSVSQIDGLNPAHLL